MGILDKFSLKGKVALVSGGAGSYGSQIVSALAEAGADIYIASRNVENSGREAQKYRQNGYDVTALPLDQGNETSILSLRDEIMKRSGRIDILVNNAVTRVMESYHDDASIFAESMQKNCTGIFLMTRAFGDIMAEQCSGSIINIGSIQGMVGPDGSLYFDENGKRYEGMFFDAFTCPDYWMHKGGMINFTRFAASYYGSKNVRCNCVSPGGLGKASPGDLDFAETKLPIEFYKRYSARTLLGRMANSTDLMGIIVFLASDASAYITGTNIPVDGGYTAK